MEFGIFSFGELTIDPTTGTRLAASNRIRQLVDLAIIADDAGLSVVGIGEHHRSDFAVTSPAIVLAAIAEATSTIRLTSSVTVLSTSDPVRVFEDFTAVDLLSEGRAEITAGRGAYTESFPLYGRRLEDYEGLFEENLELLMALNRSTTVSWSGRFRPALDGIEISPRPVQERLPVWVAVGGTPASVLRAARYGLPVYFAILGNPAGFVPLANAYRQAGIDAGWEASRLRLGVTSHFYVEETSQGARSTFFPHYSSYIGQNMPSASASGRGLSREAFDSWAAPTGALFVGSPAEIVDKILFEHELLGHDRFLAQVGLGGLSFEATARSVELLASEVVPVVTKALGTSLASR